jgi:hypothetical protein
MKRMGVSSLGWRNHGKDGRDGKTACGGERIFCVVRVVLRPGALLAKKQQPRIKWIKGMAVSSS